VQTRFRWGDLRERVHFEDLDAVWELILKFIFKKLDGEPWTVLLWLRIETGGGLM